MTERYHKRLVCLKTSDTQEVVDPYFSRTRISIPKVTRQVTRSVSVIQRPYEEILNISPYPIFYFSYFYPLNFVWVWKRGIFNDNSLTFLLGIWPSFKRSVVRLLNIGLKKIFGSFKLFYSFFNELFFYPVSKLVEVVSSTYSPFILVLLYEL